MKILFLTNNEQSSDLVNWLIEKGEDVCVLQEKINLDKIKSRKFDIIISYNYRYIIKKDVIDYYKDKIINLHISLLPWNRGADPNIWSFLENTPKGVTIHLIDEGVDTGDILFQKEVLFDEKKETLRTTYNKLQEEIQKLFKSNWEKIKNFNLKPTKQSSKGTFHYVKDFLKIKHILNDYGWDIPITVLKKRYSSLLKSGKL